MLDGVHCILSRGSDTHDSFLLTRMVVEEWLFVTNKIMYQNDKAIYIHTIVFNCLYI